MTAPNHPVPPPSSVVGGSGGVSGTRADPPTDQGEHDADAHELAMDLLAAAIAWRQTWAVKRHGERKTYGDPSGARQAEADLLDAAERYADLLPGAS